MGGEWKDTQEKDMDSISEMHRWHTRNENICALYITLQSVVGSDETRNFVQIQSRWLLLESHTVPSLVSNNIN